MAPSDHSSSAATPEQLREAVERDYARADSTDDPWEVLGVSRSTPQEEITETYEQYDHLYRAENLEKLDDNDLTRKALEVRKMISRAIVEIQAEFDQDEPDEFTAQADSTGVVASIDPDSLALADIYFRDGLSWMQLEAYDYAVDCFQRSMDHDPSRGITLAYHAYAEFKHDPEDPTAIEDCRESFETAASIAPDDLEIRVLQARFGLETRQFGLARRAIDHLEQLDPDHRDLEELRRLYEELAD